MPFNPVPLSIRKWDVSAHSAWKSDPRLLHWFHQQDHLNDEVNLSQVYPFLLFWPARFEQLYPLKKIQSQMLPEPPPLQDPFENQ